LYSSARRRIQKLHGIDLTIAVILKKTRPAWLRAGKINFDEHP